MAYEVVTPRRFIGKNRQLIIQGDAICREYEAKGYSLTLRQLYYQFVARGVIPNNDKQYEHLGQVVSNARRAGLIDWDHINDRTRYLRGYNSWDSPSRIISASAHQFKYDLWERTGQNDRPEVWVEKDALVDVVSRACGTFRVPFMSMRGYPSDSVMWEAAARMKHSNDRGFNPIIIHLGDHDPSGLDMTRDIKDRLNLFGAYPDVQRIALTMEQVEQYAPPPNPAKVTDSRYAAYVEEYGHESWELDALSPEVINELIADAIEECVDVYAWEEGERQEQIVRGDMLAVARRWSDVSNNWPAIESLLDNL